MNRWIPEENVQDCDETAPEAMAGTMYSRRFTSDEPIDGKWGVVTVQFYCDDQWQMAGAPEPEALEAPITDPVPADERYRIGQIVEFIRCTDPEQPGDTAEWTEYTYKYSWFSRAEKFTDEQIKALMESCTAKWIYWDGVIESGNQDILTNWVEPMEPKEWEMFLTDELKTWVRDMLNNRDRQMAEEA